MEHRPLACAPSGDVLRCFRSSRLQTRWAHRLQVYVPSCHSERSRGTPATLAFARNTGCLDYARHDDICKSSLPRRSIFRSEFWAVAAMVFTKSRRLSRRFHFVTRSRSSNAPANKRSRFGAMNRRCRKGKGISQCAQRNFFRRNKD